MRPGKGPLPPYGEGITFWPLARRRRLSGILETGSREGRPLEAASRDRSVVPRTRPASLGGGDVDDRVRASRACRSGRRPHEVGRGCRRMDRLCRGLGPARVDGPWPSRMSTGRGRAPRPARTARGEPAPDRRCCSSAPPDRAARDARDLGCGQNRTPALSLAPRSRQRTPRTHVLAAGRGAGSGGRP